MRGLLFAMLTIAAISAAASASAQTYNPRYPVCIKAIEMFGGEHIDCIYTSLEACKQRASGLGATCFANPFYRGRR